MTVADSWSRMQIFTVMRSLSQALSPNPPSRAWQMAGCDGGSFRLGQTIFKGPVRDGQKTPDFFAIDCTFGLYTINTRSYGTS